MEYLMTFERYDSRINDGVSDMIKKSRKLSQELKDFAISNLKSYSEYNSGVVTNLNLHTNLRKKIREKELPSGFYMGVDKNGYFIHTHRARSKSFKKPESITVKAIKFIDSTG